MRRLLLVWGVVTLLLASSLWDAVDAADEPRAASAILKEYDAVEMPKSDSTRIADSDYYRSYIESSKKARARRSELAQELFRNYPEHPRSLDLMIVGGALAELEKYLNDHPDSPRKGDILHARAEAALNVARTEELTDLTKPRDAILDFLRASPGDGRASRLLSLLTFRKGADQQFMLSIYRTIAKEQAGSRIGDIAAASVRRVEGKGKALELTFTEAMSGRPISMEQLRGKVVVIDFWSTTCGPCIADMPRLKELYAKYKDQGLEIIGVSLDEAGEGQKQMKEFVQKNAIEWPQYYQGQGFNSAFSKGWGINLIPQMFIVDADGKLHSTEAREKLDALILELIKKRDQKG